MIPGDPVPRTEPVRFGRYEVARKADGSLDKLGAGAMGVTYRARDTLLQRLVVLKVVNADLLSGDGGAARKRFLREAAAAAQLVHPHVAAVHDIGVEASKDFYVMEFVQGQSLDELVRAKGRLAAPEALTVARHVALALSAAWQHQLVHRDIKPANLMLTHPPETHEGGEGIWVKVIDFGLAKSVGPSTTEGTASMVSVTGAFLGTPAFASPEQLEGRVLDTRTDLYSLGVTLFFALAGELPFTGTTLGQLITGHLAKPPPLGKLRELFVPEPVVALIGLLLEKDPEARPADGEALLTLLDEVESQVTPPAAPVSAAVPPRRESPTIGDPVEPVPVPAFVSAPPQARGVAPIPKVAPVPPPPRAAPPTPPPARPVAPPPERPRETQAPARPNGFPLVPVLGVAGLGMLLVLLAVLEPGAKKPAPETADPPPPPALSATPTPAAAPGTAPTPVAKGSAFDGTLTGSGNLPPGGGPDAVADAERLAPSNVDGAMLILNQAANRGDVPAMSMLAAAYSYGVLCRPDRAGWRLSTGKDYNLAARWATIATERGDPRARILLANLYLGGQGVPLNPQRALDLVRPAADRGDAIAQAYLGLLYSSGPPLPVPRDPVRARAYLERAAESGYSAAKAFLGAWFTIGLNVPADPVRGIRLLEEAERAGSVVALHQLGLAYLNGYGVSKSLDRGISYLRTAARACYEPAEQELRNRGLSW